MTESQFIDKNKEHWKRLEELIQQNSIDMDAEELTQLFGKVSSDLSYARTNFQKRSVSKYLNNLVNEVFEKIKIKKKTKIWDELLEFYRKILPNLVVKHSNLFLISFFLFSFSFAIGFFSSIKDTDFPTSMLGPAYIAETENNIAKGDPMAIYKDEHKDDMFLGITMNNIKVAFLAYILGIFLGLGTVYILVSNGAMIGAFKAFFYLKSIFFTAFLTVWVHGTIEISAIIIAGAAGLVLGKSLMTPGTFTRMESLRLGVMESLYILLSTVPLFIIAGFFESYVTRLTDLPTGVKLMIIILSLIFVLTIYFVIPLHHYLSKKYNPGLTEKDEDGIHSHNTDMLNSQKSNLSQALMQFRENISNIFQYIIIPLGIIIIVCYYFIISTFENSESFNQYGYIINYFDVRLCGNLFFLIALFMLVYILSALSTMHDEPHNLSPRRILVYMKDQFIFKFIFAAIFLAVIFYFSLKVALIFSLLFPISLFAILDKNITKETEGSIIGFKLKLSLRFWINFVLVNACLLLCLISAMSFIKKDMIQILLELVNWHLVSSNQNKKYVFLSLVLFVPIVLTIISLFYFIYRKRLDYLFNRYYSEDLYQKIHTFEELNTGKI